MYFYMIWKNDWLALRELWLSSYEKIGWVLVSPDLRSTARWSVIKHGYVTTLDQIEVPSLIGTHSNDFGVWLKKNRQVRRFKLVTLDHTDLEIKHQGMEIVPLEQEYHASMQVWVVTYYQPIDIFEQIDYAKPSNGMEIGMMPSKLAMTMTNIALAQLWDGVHTIYDPFVWFGTTQFVAHYLWHHSIWSDTNASLIKPNIPWLKSQSRYNPELHFVSYKHDATQPITKWFALAADAIVSEWWLGPIVSSRLMPKVASHQLKTVWNVYTEFVKRVYESYEKIVVVITIPVYHFRDYTVDEITPMIYETPFDRSIGWMYRRPWKIMWRQVMIGVK